MAGVTGREVKAAYVRSSTWGIAASVAQGRQVLIKSTEGFDDQPMVSDDDAFSQQFVGEGQVAQRGPINTEIKCQARYEDADNWLAAACGSVAAPTAISSQGAANSLVAYQHDITLADELTHFYTIAADMSQYVKEIPTFKLRGFNLTVGDNGAMELGFPIIGNRAKYDSAVNNVASVNGARAAEIGHRLFRKDGTLRMNVQSAGALGASDVLSQVRDISLTYNRPMAGEDHVFSQDYIIEPDDDGFAELMLEVNYPRMNTVSANSLALGFGDGRAFKMDLKFLGAYINSTTQRQLLIEAPAMQIYSFRAPVVGHQQVRPVVQWRFKRAATAPTGMSGLTRPFRMTLINANSQNLLV